jgi:hypothetical protein
MYVCDLPQCIILSYDKHLMDFSVYVSLIDLSVYVSLYAPENRTDLTHKNEYTRSHSQCEITVLLTCRLEICV